MSIRTTPRGEPLPLTRKRLLELAEEEAKWLDSIGHIEGSYATYGASDIIRRMIFEIQVLERNQK